MLVSFNRHVEETSNLSEYKEREGSQQTLQQGPPTHCTNVSESNGSRVKDWEQEKELPCQPHMG